MKHLLHQYTRRTRCILLIKIYLAANHVRWVYYTYTKARLCKISKTFYCVCVIRIRLKFSAICSVVVAIYKRTRVTWTDKTIVWFCRVCSAVIEPRTMVSEEVDDIRPHIIKIRYVFKRAVERFSFVNFFDLIRFKTMYALDLSRSEHTTINSTNREEQ